MKKILAIVVGLSLVASVLSAETRISGGVGISSFSQKIDTDANGPLTISTMAPALSVDGLLTIGETNIVMLGGCQVAIPSKAGWKTNNHDTDEDLTSSTIISANIGAGYELFKAKPYPLVFGLGLAYTNAKLKFDGFDILSSYLGVNATVQGNYFFTDHIGVMIAFDYAYNFIPLSYKIEDDISSTSYKSDFASCQNYDIRLGLSYRL